MWGSIRFIWSRRSTSADPGLCWKIQISNSFTRLVGKKPCPGQLGPDQSKLLPDEVILKVVALTELTLL